MLSPIFIENNGNITAKAKNPKNYSSKFVSKIRSIKHDSILTSKKPKETNTKKMNHNIFLNQNMSTLLLNKKIDYDSFYYNDDKSILKQKILKKLNLKKKINNENSNTNISDKTKNINNISLNKISLITSKYKNNYIRKPLLIKIEKGININNIYNNSNIYNNNITTPASLSKESLIKSYTERRIYPINYLNKKIEKNKNNKSELFRNFKDLEKKSEEISKKLKKKTDSNISFKLKKNNNLLDIKQSLEDIRIKENKNNKSNQNSIKAIYRISKSKISNMKNKLNEHNKSNTIHNLKKLFIAKNKNNNDKNNNTSHHHQKAKTKINFSPYVNKKYFEDNIAEKISNLCINNADNNRNKKRKFLTSIIEENTKNKTKDMQININKLINVLQKIMRDKNKNIFILKDSFYKIKNKTNNKRMTYIKKNNYIYNTAKPNPHLKYIKKIIHNNLGINRYKNHNSNINKK
jgi:hypothetical protein